MNISRDLQLLLEREIPVLTADIRSVYRALDKKFGLRGACVPITFSYDEDTLGSYTPNQREKKEEFHFSLLFVGYAVKKPLSRSDRLDLYLHEYAHYMQYNMEIPREYCFQGGIHGSAWKYCCSLVGAAPTPYYKVGESLMKHDYDQALTNPKQDKNYVIRDQYRREQTYRAEKNSMIRYQISEEITHPKYGRGIIERIEQAPGSVLLHIRFGDELKKIDQNWLFRAQHKATQPRNRS